MNHLELFLKASTQMVFIVYASLSVLRGFRVSTLVKGCQNSQGRAGLPYPMPAMWKETSSFVPVEHQDKGIGIPRAYLQLLQVILSMY